MREVGGQSRGSKKDSQKDADLGSTLGADPAARSAESSDLSSRGIRGVMYVECCVCHVALPSIEVAADDKANGQTSHGYCPPHEAEVLEAAKVMRVPFVKEPPPIRDSWGYTRGFISGLWVILLIPHALLQAALGGGR